MTNIELVDYIFKNIELLHDSYGSLRFSPIYKNGFIYKDGFIEHNITLQRVSVTVDDNFVFLYSVDLTDFSTTCIAFDGDNVDIGKCTIENFTSIDIEEDYFQLSTMYPYSKDLYIKLNAIREKIVHLGFLST